MINIFDSPLLNILLNLLFYLIIIIGLILLFRFIKTLNDPIKRLINYLTKWFYLILFIPALLFAFFYYYYSFNENFNTDYKEYDKLIGYLGQLSLMFFGSGIFTVSLKFLDSINVFKENFKKIIMSAEFEKLLTDKIETLAYSEKHLIKQENLEDIWEKITLCKYQKQFPGLYDELKSNIKNVLFTKDNISYYYKHFTIKYNFTLSDDNNTVKILNHTKYTIVRPNKDPFIWDFKMKLLKEDDESNNVEIKFRITNQDGVIFESDDLEESTDGAFVEKKVSKELSGHIEYHIDRKIVSFQNIDKDREYSFGSDRIIDDLDVGIKYSSNLNIFFSNINQSNFLEEEIDDENETSYVNRDLLLPGEKFKLFLIRKD